MSENQLQWVNRKVQEGAEEILATDIRTGMPGGMRFMGTTAQFNTSGGPVVDYTKDFTITQRMLLPVDFQAKVGGNETEYIGAAHGGMVLWTQNGSDVRLGVKNVIDSGFMFSSSLLPLEEPFSLTIRRSGNTITALVNGIVNGTITGSSPAVAAAFAVGPHATGNSITILGVTITNFAMTDDEVEGASRGESRGRLANQAIAFPPSGVFTGALGSGTVSDASSTGFTLTGSSGRYMQLAHSVALPAGQTALVTFNATAGGSVYIENGTTPGSPVAFSAGVVSVVITVGPDGDRSTTTIFTGDTVVSNFTVTPLGTVANYAPDNCTSLNRWLDNSGNGHDLLPVSGCIALNPQPQKVRHTIGVYRLATPAVISGPSYVTQSRQSNPGVLRLTFPSWMWNQLQVKGQSGTYVNDPCIVYGDTTHTSGHLDIYCWKANGTPGLVNEDIAWRSSHLE